MKPILTLLDKQKTFAQKFNKIILEKEENPKPCLFLKSHLEEKYFVIYNEYLEKLDTLQDVKVYVQNIISAIAK